MWSAFHISRSRSYARFSASSGQTLTMLYVNPVREDAFPFRESFIQISVHCSYVGGLSIHSVALERVVCPFAAGMSRVWRVLCIAFQRMSTRCTGIPFLLDLLSEVAFVSVQPSVVNTRSVNSCAVLRVTCHPGGQLIRNNLLCPL